MADEYDVFLSYNHRDIKVARQISSKLQAQGVKVWFDEDKIPPGRVWPAELDKAVEQCRTAAVLVGPDGRGPWQRNEIWTLLVVFVNKGRPVIPVLLPGAPEDPDLPHLLEMFGRCSLREGIFRKGISDLIFGIRGERSTVKKVRPAKSSEGVPQTEKPLASAAGGMEQSLALPAEAAGSSPGILLVDDEDDFRYVFRQNLEDDGYLVFEAGNGLDALDLFRKHERELDLVITDMRMPRMDGEALIRELGTLNPDLPVIVVTGYLDLRDTRKLLKEGDYYIEKPLPPRPIVQRMVAGAVKKHRQKVEEPNPTETLVRGYARSVVWSRMRHLPRAVARKMLVELATSLGGGDGERVSLVDWNLTADRKLVFHVLQTEGVDPLSLVTLCIGHSLVRQEFGVSSCNPADAINTLRQSLLSLQGEEPRPHVLLPAFMGCLDLDSGELTYASADHHGGMLFRLTEEGLAATRLSTAGDLTREILQIPCLLLLCWEGATGEPPGMESALKRLKSKPAEEIITAIGVHLHQELQRDATLLLLKVSP